MNRRRNDASAWKVGQVEGDVKLAEGSGGEARRRSQEEAPNVSARKAWK